jgi:hypothetical protein
MPNRSSRAHRREASRPSRVDACRRCPKHGLTCELSGHRQRGARPVRQMINRTAARAWCHAVGAPLERGVSQRTPCHSTAQPRVPPLLSSSRPPRARLEATADARTAAAPQTDFQPNRLTCAAAPCVLAEKFCIGLHVSPAQRLRPFVAVQFTPAGADFVCDLHCFPTLPNVRVKWPPAAWRLGCVDDDKQHGHAAKAPRRWRST